MAQQIEEKLQEFIVENFLFARDNHRLRNGDSLLEGGVVDSTGVLELVTFLEQQFEFAVEDEELTLDNLDSVNRIAAFIRRKRPR